MTDLYLQFEKGKYQIHQQTKSKRSNLPQKCCPQDILLWSLGNYNIMKLYYKIKSPPLREFLLVSW